MKKKEKIFLVLFLVAVIATGVYFAIKGGVFKHKETVQDIVQLEKTQMDNEKAAYQEYVNFQKTEYYDSIYKIMPEIVLVEIVKEHNTEKLEKFEIVRLYLKDKVKYDNMVKAAKEALENQRRIDNLMQ